MERVCSPKTLYNLAYQIVKDDSDTGDFLYNSLTVSEQQSVNENTPKLVNRKTTKDYDFYIGRPSLFGNSFKVGENCTKEQAVELFTQKQLPKMLKSDKCIEQLEAMRGKTIACWCVPEACHGEVIRQLIRFRNILEH